MENLKGKRVAYIGPGKKKGLLGTITRHLVLDNRVEVTFDKDRVVFSEHDSRAYKYRIDSIQDFADHPEGSNKVSYLQMLVPARKTTVSSHSLDATSFAVEAGTTAIHFDQEKADALYQELNSINRKATEESKMENKVKSVSGGTLIKITEADQYTLAAKAEKFYLVCDVDGVARYRLGSGKKNKKLARKIARDLAAEAKGRNGIFYVMKVVSAHQVAQADVLSTIFEANTGNETVPGRGLK